MTQADQMVESTPSTIQNQFDVCILAAGFGSRMEHLTDNTNKALLCIDNKTLLAHIIDRTPSTSKIIIAVGYKGDLIKQYVAVAYPDRNIVCEDITDYQSEYSGPGTSALLACKKHAPSRLIVWAVDTMLDDEATTSVFECATSTEQFDHDIVFTSLADHSASGRRYCCVAHNGNHSLPSIVFNSYPDPNKNQRPFVGVALINDTSSFFDRLESEYAKKHSHVELAHGIGPEFICFDIDTHKADAWTDVGSFQQYVAARTKRHAGSFNFDKQNETTSLAGDRVVKFSIDENATAKRFESAKKLTYVVPKITGITKNFISYAHVPGETLYSRLTPALAAAFYRWCDDFLWHRSKYLHMSLDARRELTIATRTFYKQKTYARLDMFHEKYADTESHEQFYVNETRVVPIKRLLSCIDWDWLCTPTPARIHGDLQFDNVIVTDSGSSAALDKFVLIDWRTDFGGLFGVGDLYYDLAKMYGGLTLPYDNIKKNRFSYLENKDKVRYHFETSSTLNNSLAEYQTFVASNRFDSRKISLLRALIFLNMAPLHEYPFDKMLYHMSGYHMQRALFDENTRELCF